MTNSGALTKSDLQKYLNQIQVDGRFTEVILTDEHGLVICSTGSDTDQIEKQAAFFSMIQRVSNHATREMRLAGASEFTFVDVGGEKLVVKPFQANGSELILAIYLKKQSAPYKRILGASIRTIQSVWTI